MPYSVGSKNLPSNVKKMKPKAQRAWVKIWNSSYSRCTAEKKKKGGGKPLSDIQKKACETRAFKIANAMAGKLELYPEGGVMNGLFYIDLATLKLGKIFDAVVSGSFVDMLGRKVTFKKSDLAAYVKNTMAAIEATTTESGEIVGLPIDARGHEKGDGAGWIVEAKLEDGKVRLLPKWTEIGQELIQKGIRRFFSPTVDTENKVILGGTLTNWPATRDKKGKILLRPIELEREDFLVVDENQEFGDELKEPIEDEEAELAESLNEKSSAVRSAFREQFLPKRDKEIEMTPWVIDVFEDHAIVQDGQKYFSAPFGKDDKGKVTFAKKSEWKEVKKSWVEATLDQVRQAIDFFRAQFKDVYKVEKQDSNLEVIEMEMTQEELKELVAGQVTATMAELMTPPADPDAEPGDGDPDAEPKFDMLKLFEMEDASEEFRAAVKTQMLQYYEEQRALVLDDAAKEIDKVKRESHVSEFSARVTGGTEDDPRGIATEPEELKKFILGLDPDEAKYIQNLLEKLVQGDGIVEFKEIGHGKKQVGTTPIPAYVAEMLDAKELKIEDLSDPMLGLGDVSQYDLAKWQKQEA